MIKVGHCYTVTLMISHKTWYPSQGGTEAKANEWTHRTSYDLICLKLGVVHCAEMIEDLISQDHGELGVHNGVGNAWNFRIDKVEYKGEVRM